MDCALQISRFSGELLEMLFCMKNVRINLFSNTNDNKNSVFTLLFGILFFVVCLPVFETAPPFHPFVQKQLLRSRYPSSNLIGQPVFSLCETEKIRRIGRKKTFAFSVRECSRPMWKHPEAVVLFQRVNASEIRFAFSRSVWKGLNTC